MSFLVLAVPTELAAGRYPAPAWAILGLGGAVVIGVAVYLSLRLRRSRRVTMGGTPKPPAPPEQR